MKINLRKTIEKNVPEKCEFYFYVDELTSNDYMPTYEGIADDKYMFEKMDDDFFEFIERKSNNDGIYIRLIHTFDKPFKTDDEILNITGNGEVITIGIESVNYVKNYKTDLEDEIQVCEIADYGIKVKNGDITFGTSIFGGCGQTPYFAEFGSKRGNQLFLSLENPLNKLLIDLMKELIVYD